MPLRPCEPDLRDTPSGWLASSPPDYPYRIGVVGQTEEEARRRFVVALAAWSELHERAATARWIAETRKSVETGETVQLDGDDLRQKIKQRRDS